jgi:predicted Zn-dependent peptidase
MQSVHAFFDDAKRKDLPKRNRVQDPKIAHTTQRIVHENSRNANTILMSSFQTLNFKEDPVLFWATLLLVQVLCGNDTSCMRYHFVEKEKLLLNLGMSYGESLDPSFLECEATLAPLVSAETFLKKFNEYLKEIAKNGFREEDITHAKHDMLSQKHFLREGNSQAKMFYLALACGINLETLESWFDSIQSVTSADLERAFRFIFESPPRVLMELHPKS